MQTPLRWREHSDRCSKMTACAPTIALLLQSLPLVTRVRKSPAATCASWSQWLALPHDLTIPTYELGYTPGRSGAEANLAACRSVPHAAEMASVASCPVWRTRNSLAAVSCRSDESGDRHWGRRRRVRILFATMGTALHSI